MSLLANVKEAAQYIQDKSNYSMFDLAIIHGTGMKHFGESIEGLSFPVEEIPGYPDCSVTGKPQKIVITRIADKDIICFQGRLHYYEGSSIQDVAFPVRLMKELGVLKLLIVAQAGGINRSFVPGDIMLVTDHINNMGVNPLVGPNVSEHGGRFPDLCNTYSRELNNSLLEASPVSLKQGVLMGVSGPNYETPAEITAYRMLGADAVSMTVIPEALTAAHCGIDTSALICITNHAAGLAEERLSQDEVVAISRKIELDLEFLVRNFIGVI
jgi:purine-nucleoside phosphorylase